MQLIFERRVTKRTPGRFRTRVLTEGVTPSLHIDYKRTRIKQYHKEGRALRTETTINNTRDFGIGKRLHNLPALREIGFQANRRLLDVQPISHDCAVGEDAFRQVNEPVVVDGPTGQCACVSPTWPCRPCSAPCWCFVCCLGVFPTANCATTGLPCWGKRPDDMTPGQMTYHLRRLRLHGLIERMPKTHRYRVTRQGWRTALFCTRTYNRILRPGLAQIIPNEVQDDSDLRRLRPARPSDRPMDRGKKVPA